MSSPRRRAAVAARRRARSSLRSRLAAPAAPARAPPPPPPISAPSAIVMEPATGDVRLRARGRRRAAPSPPTTKLMTALLTMERARLGDVVAARADYRALPVESQLGLRTGERMTVADLAARPDARVGQRRGRDARGGRRAARAPRVRPADEPARPRARAHGHALRQPDRARRAAQLLLRARPRRGSPSRCAACRSSAALADRTRAVARSGDRTRTVRNRNTLVGDGPRWVNGLKTGHTLGAGYVLVGTGTRARRHRRLRGARHALGGRRATATRSQLLSLGH